MDTHGGNPYKSLELKQVSIVQINVDSTREWFLVHIFLYLIMFLLHLCPGLHTITNFTVLCRFATKNRGRNDFSHFTIFPYFFVFSTYQRALPNEFCGEIVKIGAATTNFTLLFFVTFWFVSLTRRGFRIQQILRKWQKIGAATIFRSFFFSHLPEGASEFNKFCENIEKSWSRRFFALCCSHLPERASELN